MARELYFTARVLRADEAFKLGMLNRVVPAAQLEQAAKAFAQELAGMPTVAPDRQSRPAAADRRNLS